VGIWEQGRRLVGGSDAATGGKAFFWGLSNWQPVAAVWHGEVPIAMPWQKVCWCLANQPVKLAKAVAAIAGGGVVPGMDLAAHRVPRLAAQFDRFDTARSARARSAGVWAWVVFG